MFSNYASGVHITDKHCHDHPEINPVDEFYEKDAYGNIVKLTWSPEDEVTIELTSDSNLPIYERSQVFIIPGEIPNDSYGRPGQHAYNTVDNKCWKYNGNYWEELPEIAICKRSHTIITFTSIGYSTHAMVKNFRGECVYAISEVGTNVHITVNEELSKLLRQGFYNVDVYRVNDTITEHVRRIPLSVGYPSGNTSINIPPHPCHPCSPIATDETLKYDGQVMSVNTTDEFEYGNTLPISSHAAFINTQPRNLVVHINKDTNTSMVPLSEILSHVANGGEVVCIHEDYGLAYSGSTDEYVKFVGLIAENGVLEQRTVIITSDNKVNVSRGTIDTVVGDTMYKSIDSLEERVDSLESKGYDDGEIKDWKGETG